MARRGAAEVTGEHTARAEWRRTVADPDAEWEPESWVRTDELRTDDAGRGPARGVDRGRAGATGDDREVDPEVDDLGTPLSAARAKVVRRGLRDAARSFQREYYVDADRMLRRLVEQAPGSPPVRELYGLTLYRLERWKAAAQQLESFRELEGTTEQHPVLADCYRALGRHDRVARLWDELREASPSAELVTEGRIVAAGSLADADDLRGAINLLAKNWRFPRNPRDHHLRRAYALADLYERAGEIPRARELFGRIARADGRFADVGRRVRSLA